MRDGTKRRDVLTKNPVFSKDGRVCRTCTMSPCQMTVWFHSVWAMFLYFQHHIPCNMEQISMSNNIWSTCIHFRTTLLLRSTIKLKGNKKSDLHVNWCVSIFPPSLADALVTVITQLTFPSAGRFVLTNLSGDRAFVARALWYPCLPLLRSPLEVTGIPHLRFLRMNDV